MTSNDWQVTVSYTHLDVYKRQQVHYTDTGGATDHVFALCHLLGLRFVPRLRDLADRRLGTIEPASGYKGLRCV